MAHFKKKEISLSKFGPVLKENDSKHFRFVLTNWRRPLVGWLVGCNLNRDHSSDAYHEEKLVHILNERESLTESEREVDVSVAKRERLGNLLTKWCVNECLRECKCVMEKEREWAKEKNYLFSKKLLQGHQPVL